MSVVRSFTLWGIGLAAIASTAWVDGSATTFGPWYPIGAVAIAVLLLATWTVMRRRSMLDAAVIVSVVALILAGPRPGASVIAAAIGMALIMAAYYMLRLEARINEDGQDTTEGRRRSHQAVTFASRRILMVVSASAVAAVLIIHLPILIAPWISPRWAVSIDATSTQALLVFAIPYLVLATAWTLIRLGRPVPGPLQETTSAKTDEAQRHD